MKKTLADGITMEITDEKYAEMEKTQMEKEGKEWVSRS